VDCSSLSYWQYNLTKNSVTDISVLTTHTKLQEHDNWAPIFTNLQEIEFQVGKEVSRSFSHPLEPYAASLLADAKTDMSGHIYKFLWQKIWNICV